MNLALIRRFWLDSLPLGLAAIAAILLFEIFLAKTLSTFDLSAIQSLMKISFVRNAWKSLLGSDLMDVMSGTGLATIGIAHPFVYLVAAVLVISEATRVIVGEIDRGSADVLLALPVRRSAVYISATAVLAGWGLLLVAAALVGLWIGLQFSKLFEPVDFGKLLPLIPNMYLLVMSVGCLTMGISAFLTRRGRAIGAIVAYLLYSFVINFLSNLWPALTPFAKAGVLYWYQPLAQVRDDSVAIMPLIVLSCVAGISWAIGLSWYCRRDIPA